MLCGPSRLSWRSSCSVTLQVAARSFGLGHETSSPYAILLDTQQGHSRTSVLDLKFLWCSLVSWFGRRASIMGHQSRENLPFSSWQSADCCMPQCFPEFWERWKFTSSSCVWSCLIFDTRCCFFANISSSAILDRHVFQRKLHIHFVQFATFAREEILVGGRGSHSTRDGFWLFDLASGADMTLAATSVIT